MLSARRAGPVLLAAGASLALAACGGGDPAPRDTSRPLPISAIDPNADRAVVIPPRAYRRPVANYLKHVDRELAAMQVQVGRMNAAIATGDLSGARAAWLRGDYRYETIGAAYGAFGDLDAAVNGLPGGLQGGARSKEFTGLHRVELALWARRSTRDARAPGLRLARDVAKLRKAAPKSEIDPLDFALRAHEVLEDTLHLQLAGRASPWAGAALTALDANIVGTRVVMKQLAPLAMRTNPVRVDRAQRSVDRLDRAVEGLRRDGRLPRWDALGQVDRERIAGLTAGAAEDLAYIPELVDPRPPRPLQPAIEDQGP
jgi:iron uptake system EfeUOB component EfeO/EfeM